MKYILKIFVSIITIGTLVPLVAFAQWSGPTSTPPTGNISAPLNTSSTAQSKAGGLLLNTGGATDGLIVQSGYVGLGTLSPANPLEVWGKASVSSGQTPYQTNGNAWEGDLGGTSNYVGGYSFTPDTNGTITTLSARVPGYSSYTIYLYNQSSQALLASATITGAGIGSWVSSNITPVIVSSGTSYVVAVGSTSNDMGYSTAALGAGQSYPQKYGDITLNYSLDGTPVSSFPTNHVTTVTYGDADVTFVPGGSSTSYPTLAVANGGYVGIDKSTPAYPLDVNGNASVTGLFDNGKVLVDTDGSNAWKGWSAVYQPGGLYVQSDQGQARVELMTANQNGSVRSVFSGMIVGGSLASPTATPAGMNVQYRMIGYDGTNYSNAAEMDLTADQTFTTNSTPSDIYFYTTASGSNSDRIVGEFTAAGNFLVPQGYVQANAYYSNSDRRLKTNIENISTSTALSDILQLQGVSYDWKNPSMGTGPQIGLIAQDVQKVFPQIVHTDASTTLESVDYAKLVAPLIEAVKAEEDQITTQNTEIETLEAEVAALKAGK